MTDGVDRRTTLRRRSILRRVFIGGALGLLTALAIAVPEALLAKGTRDAQDCLAKYPEPRGPESPSCGAAGKPLLFPAHVPWTANRARHRAEELGVRIAYFDYVDAAVGKPDRQALGHAAEAIEHQAALVKNGSARLTMKELGLSVGTPNLGQEADLLGDRRTLLERGEMWFNWSVRLSTLRAALLSGDIAKTEALAKRYAVDDPYDPDIRSAVAAVLCMGSDPDKGAHMVVSMQDDRAARQYEGLSRDYGEVRALLVACLAKTGKPPPPLPADSPAGSADAVEQRALLRVRIADTPAAESPRTEALATVVKLLEGGPRHPGARLALLASLLTIGTDHDAAKIVRLSKPKFDEPPIAPPLHLTALEWVSDHRPTRGDADPAALLPGATFLAAANTLVALETKGDEAADKPNDQDAPKADSDEVRRGLVALRGALLLEAAASLTRDGNMDAALTAVDDAARVLGLNTHARNLLRSNVYWLSGNREKAFSALETDGGIVHGADAREKRLLAAMSVQESELAMSLGKTEIALQAARRAKQFATEANDPQFFARAMWMLAALGEVKAEPPPVVEVRKAAPFPAVGFADPAETWHTFDLDKQRTLLDRALEPWVGLAAADPALRRAGRWAAMRARGDAPPWLSVHLLLASRLLDPTEGDHEVWFDALLALDQRRFSLRSYAFARAEAARMRGDAESATMWDGRYRALRKLAAEHTLFELTRHLDI